MCLPDLKRSGSTFANRVYRDLRGLYTGFMKRVSIDYTVYSPDYVPGEGECWDNRTVRGARRKAQALGVGSLIVRNFNRDHRFDWWQSPFCWVWNGFTFKKSYSQSEKQWKVDSFHLSQALLLRRFPFDNR